MTKGKKNFLNSRDHSLESGFDAAIKNFLIITLPAPNDNRSQLKAEAIAKGRVFNPISCARRYFILSKAEYDEIPDEIKNHPELMQYQDYGAYHFLLRVATGLVSAKKGEPEILNQLKTAWNDFKRRQIERDVVQSVTAIQPLIKQVFKDAALIRTNYCNDIKPLSTQSSAINIANITGGRVLLVGTEREHLNTMLRALGRSYSGKVREIIVGSADNSERQLNVFLNKIESLQQKRFVASNIDIATSIDELLADRKQHLDAIVIATSLEGSVERNKDLIRKIQDTRLATTVIHIPQSYPEPITELWADAGFENFIGRYQINEQYKIDEKHRNSLIVSAENAIINICWSRKKGLPIPDEISSKPAKAALGFFSVGKSNNEGR